MKAYDTIKDTIAFLNPDLKELLKQAMKAAYKEGQVDILKEMRGK
jgi:hypothetical protein